MQPALLTNPEQRRFPKKQGVHLPPLFWPISHPGPYVTPPPPGYVRVPTRTDQVMEAKDLARKALLFHR